MYLLPSWIGSKLASCSGLDFMTFFEQRLQQNARGQVTSVTKMSRSINGWRNTCRFAALCNSFLRLSFETPNPTTRANNSPLNYFCSGCLLCLFTHWDASQFMVPHISPQKAWIVSPLQTWYNALVHWLWNSYSTTIGKQRHQAAHLDRLRWPGLEVGQGCQRTRVEKCWKASWWQVIECRLFLTAGLIFLNLWMWCWRLTG